MISPCWQLYKQKKAECFYLVFVPDRIVNIAVYMYNIPTPKSRRKPPRGTYIITYITAISYRRLQLYSLEETILTFFSESFFMYTSRVEVKKNALTSNSVWGLNDYETVAL